MPMRLWSRFFSKPPAEPVGPQFGALPYKIVDGQVVVLLITSRGRGKWIFPKGRQMEGKTPWESAELEAYEEAGVVGEIETTPIGSYFLPVTEERPSPSRSRCFRCWSPTSARTGRKWGSAIAIGRFCPKPSG